MTKRTKLKQGNNRLDTVSPEEVQEALKLASLWLTDMLEGRTEKGPFCEAALGEPARVYYLKRAYLALKSGEWKWKESLKLSTQLIRIMRSDIQHTLEAWKAVGQPEMVTVNRMEPELMRKGQMMMSDMELAEEQAAHEQKRDLGYEIAFAAVKDDPMLTQYVQLVRDLNDYRAIALKMRITMQQVRELERIVLSRLSPITGARPH